VLNGPSPRAGSTFQFLGFRADAFLTVVGSLALWVH
jgi:hypothetical protein